MATSVSAGVALGRFVWHDLLTRDLDAAIAFYTKIVGWTTTVWPGAVPYTMWTTPEGPVGGIMPLPAGLTAAGVPPHWMAYVSTPDCDATASQAVKFGGQIRRGPADIPEVGRFAVISDPQGGVIAVFTPQNERPASDVPPRIYEFSWHELLTPDQLSVFEFYHALFAWEKTDAIDMGPEGVYQMYGQAGQSYGGMYTPGVPQKQAPASWLHYIRVKDTDATAAQIPALGGSISHGPMDVPNGGRILVGFDPQGAAFALHSQKA